MPRSRTVKARRAWSSFTLVVCAKMSLVLKVRVEGDGLQTVDMREHGEGLLFRLGIELRETNAAELLAQRLVVFFAQGL